MRGAQMAVQYKLYPISFIEIRRTEPNTSFKKKFQRKEPLELQHKLNDKNTSATRRSQY